MANPGSLADLDRKLLFLHPCLCVFMMGWLLPPACGKERERMGESHRPSVAYPSAAVMTMALLSTWDRPRSSPDCSVSSEVLVQYYM